MPRPGHYFFIRQVQPSHGTERLYFLTPGFRLQDFLECLLDGVLESNRREHPLDSGQQFFVDLNTNLSSAYDVPPPEESISETGPRGYLSQGSMDIPATSARPAEVS